MIPYLESRIASLESEYYGCSATDPWEYAILRAKIEVYESVIEAIRRSAQQAAA